LAGAFVEHVEPGTQRMIALPPPAQQGAVDYGRVFVSLASDTPAGGPTARVRFAMGRAGDFFVKDNLEVPEGRQFFREARRQDQVVSIIHRSGPAVSVLVEFETRPDF
jgi:hypothetical protein